MSTWAEQAKAALDGLGDTPTADEARAVTGQYPDTDMTAAIVEKFSGGGGGGGGSQTVGCVLACDAEFDIRTVGNYAVLWDALYDNFWDLNPLSEIPAGLGLTFAFDGSSSLVVPTEAGVWTFSYLATRDPDDHWTGNLNVGGIGANFAWVQQTKGSPATGTPYLSASLATPLPAGTQLTHQVATVVDAATISTYVCSQMYLSIIRQA